MIQPVLSGSDLLADLRAAAPDPGEVCVWWLGQSGYAFKTASAWWLVDPYLSESLTVKYAATEKPHIRMTQAPLRGDEITEATLVFSSHSHTDHFDGETLGPLFRASPQARLVLPARQVASAEQMGIARERQISTTGDETLHLDGGLTVHVLPSAHPEIDRDDATGHAYVGFVFEIDGLRLYHSGDTVLYDGLAERLAGLDPDIAFLPINGARLKGGEPVVAPNMHAADAVGLAKRLDTRLLVPHHYDMFTFNTADVGAFADLARAAGQPYTVLRPGERYTYMRAAHG
jgi:L-ascorbate metabolism protein UlaG (beta-lactamase superfamily)